MKSEFDWDRLVEKLLNGGEKFNFLELLDEINEPLEETHRGIEESEIEYPIANKKPKRMILEFD